MRSNGFAYAGVFLISFATLMFELLLVRILSVTMTAHLAFVAISIVMCGMTIGALVVALAPTVFKDDRTQFWLSVSALSFGLTEILALWIHLQTRFKYGFDQTLFLPMALTYACMTVPFICGGMCICLAMARYSDKLGKMYASNLFGAALACLVLPILLNFCDALTACIVVACLAAIAGLAFAIGAARRLMTGSLIVSIFLAGMSFFNWQSHWLKITWAAGHEQEPVQFENWTSYSRVVVRDIPGTQPLFWSASVVTPEFSTRQKVIDIDSQASSYMPFFDGNLQKLDYLKFDFVNVGYYLRKNANVLVIGVGGGRDILSALLFGAREVTAVEINEAIIHLLAKNYSDFNTIVVQPQVHLVNEDARSFLTRSSQKYDFIHLSLVDTGAATASGALTFTENSIYTVEAWKLCIERLTDRGIFSVSYWYESSWPALFHRMVYMAAAALRAENINHPGGNIIILTNSYRGHRVGTILIGRSPFSKEDLKTIEEIASSLKYEILLAPKQSKFIGDASVLSKLTPKAEPIGPSSRFEPPTDDRPFAFAEMGFHRELILNSVEVIPLAVAFIFTLLGIFLPLALVKRDLSCLSSLPFITYFGAIGLGFIFFEMSQMQELTIFLGHPALSLSVVLGALLFSSGIGSFLIQTNALKNIIRNPQLILAAIVLGFLLYFVLAPKILDLFCASTVIVKVLIAITLISPLGVLMGMALPIGMARIVSYDRDMVAWMWGINGALTVLGSVIAVLLAMHFGITLVLELAILSYALAFACSMFWRQGKLTEGT